MIDSQRFSRRARRGITSLLLGLCLFALTAIGTRSAWAATGDPTQVSAQVDGLNVNVSWTAGSAPDVTGYLVSTVPASPVLSLPAGALSGSLTGVRPNTTYQVKVTALHGGTAGEAVSAPGSVRVSAPGGSFVGLSPTRVLDTRTGLGVAAAGATRSVTLQAAGAGEVPASDVSAVVLNVAAVQPTARGYVTVFPADVARPSSSNVNFVAGQTKANLVIVPVSTTGQVTLVSSVTTQLVADVSGYFTSASTASPTSGLLHPVQPVRVMDTRNGLAASTPGPGGQVRVKVLGQGGVPEDGVSSVVLNTAVVKSSANGFLTAYPSGDYRPTASTVNFRRGQSTSNRTILPVGSDGYVSFYNSAGKTPVVVDVTGWFTAAGDRSATGSYFVPLTPTRIVDTRSGLGVDQGPLGSQQTLSVDLAGTNSIPGARTATPPTAAVTTVSVVNPSTNTYATVFPSLTARPTSSDINAAARTSVPNVSLSGLGTDGRLAIYNNSGTTQVVVDLSGYFVGNVHVPDSTVVLGKGQVAAIAGSPAGSATVTLDVAAPTVAVGQILASTVTSVAPQGLLVQVVSVSPDGSGRQVVQTQPATLQEAVGSVDFSVRIPVGTVSEPKTRRRCSDDSSSYVETTFSAQPTLNVQASLGWSGQRPSLRSTTYADLTASTTAAFSSEGKATCRWREVLARSTSPAVTFPIGTVPVVVIPQVTVSLDAELDGTAEIASSVSQQFSARAGLRWNGSVEPVQQASNDVSFDPLKTDGTDGDAAVSLSTAVVGRFYGIAGPTVEVTASTRASVSPTATPEWSLVADLDAAADLNFEASVIDVSAQTGPRSLFHQVLAQAGGIPKADRAVTLAFTELPYGTVVAKAYQPLGIRFSGGSFITSDSANPGSPVLAGGSGFGSPVTGTFVNPDGSGRDVSTLTLDLGYINTPGSTEVLAYDKNGSLLATVVADFVGIEPVSISRPGIRSFVVRSAGVETSGWAIDNLAFTGFTGKVKAAAAAAARRQVVEHGSTKG